MLWFNEAKDYGYIEGEAGERVYVHRSAFRDGHTPVGRCKGLAVEFTMSGSEGSYLAAEVSQVAADDQRRAIRRHGGGRPL